VHEREPQDLIAEPAAPAPAVAAPARLAATPALMRSLQTRVGNAIVARAIAAREATEDVSADEEAIPLGGGAGAPAAGGPAPSFDHSGGKTVAIDADSAVDFSNAITAQIGTPHTSPEFTPDVQVTWQTRPDGAEVPGSRKITSIDLAVKTSITKVRFGKGRPDAENKAMIDQMVTEIQAHEERHRAIVEAAAKAALTAAQAFVGKNKESAVRTALTKTLECATNKQHEALDAAEGLLTVSEVRQPDGTIKLVLTKSASGAKYPC